MSKESVEAHAVKIAAKVMQAGGLCRYDTVDKCRRINVDENTCEKCIRMWLISKAKKELEQEEDNGNL